MSKWKKIGLSVLLLFAGFAVYSNVSYSLANRPVFYRVSIDFESRGQKGVLDAVVKCDVRRRKMPFGFGQEFNDYYPNPVLYAVKLPDGSGVMTRVGNSTACDRAWRHLHNDPYWERKRDGIPEMPYSGMPRLTWLRDFATKDYAEIYLGQASYEQPNAMIRYGRTEVAAATSNQYDQWLKQSKDNADKYLLLIDYTSTNVQQYEKGLRAKHCLADIALDDYKLDESLKFQQWTSNVQQRYSIIPLEILKQMNISEFFDRFYEMHNAGGLRWRPFEVPREILQSDKYSNTERSLRLILPVENTQTGLTISRSRYGILSCHTDDGKTYGRTYTISLEGQKMLLGGNESATYYDAKERRLHAMNIQQPAW